MKPSTEEASARQLLAQEHPVVALRSVGVKYRLLTESYTTLKGRVLGSLSPGRAAPAEFWALRDVSFQVGSGEVVGVLGPNGSGKSTLLRTIAHILDPAEGSVTTNGRIQPLLDLGAAMNGELTGRENAYLYAALNRISRMQMEEMMQGIIDFTELGPFFDVPMKTYSSGMIARLGFALATAQRPDVLLVDEVLAVGDEQFQRKSYFRMLKQIEAGSVVIIVSHNLAFIQQICRRALLFFAGRLVADGPPTDVISDYRNRLGM